MYPHMLGRPKRTQTSISPMQRWADRFLSPWWPEWNELSEEGGYPVDLREEDGTYIVDAELPGFRREEVSVDVDKDMLRISAERRPEQHEGKAHLNERRYYRVQRSLRLPGKVDEENVEARLSDGVLHLELPEKEGSTSRRIEIQ